MNCDVAVIGAGVSGLATAYQLAQSGYDTIVLERQVSVGGNAISERFDGFLMEHGPSTMNAVVPESMNFIRELGLHDTAIDLGARVRRRYLLDGDRLHGISTHPAGFFLSNYLSFKAKLSLATEFFRPQSNGDDEETIHDFAARRFGLEFAERVMDPLAAGLFAGDATALSVRSVFPKLVEFEQQHGSILRAVVAAKRGSEPGRRLFSWPHGIATLPKLLARHLADRIHTGVAVTDIQATANGFDIITSDASVKSRAVVLAVQPHVAADLLERISPTTAEAAAQITAPPLAVVFLGYKADQIDHPLDGLGYLSTRSANSIITGAQFCSTMFSGRAPNGHVSIAAYVGGARHLAAATWPIKDLIDRVKIEIGELLGISNPPVVQRARQWPRGLPQYMLGHTGLVEEITSAHQHQPGLYLTGNYIAGVSVANCLKRAGQSAAAVSDYLCKPRQTSSRICSARTV